MFLARLTGKRPAGSGRWIVCIWWSLLSLSFPSPMGAYTTNLEFPLGFNLRETLQCNKEKKIPFCLRDIAHAAPVFDCYQAEVFYCVFCCFDLGCQPNCFFFFPAAGISATSEDIPNKIEDLRSECSSDFGGKDSVTSPDGEESGHGRRVSHPR